MVVTRARGSTGSGRLRRAGRLGGGSALVLAIALLSACARSAPRGAGAQVSAPRSAPAATHTATRSGAPAVSLSTVTEQFAPLRPDGSLAVAARPGPGGTCFATSIAVPLSGVYRCLAGNTLLDPCFAPAHVAHPSRLVCFRAPWATGQSMALHGKLPGYQPLLGQGNPWAIQLSDGVRCIAVTGAVPSSHGIDLGYTCPRQRMAGLTVQPDASLTAHYGRASGPLKKLGVSVQWRGRSYRFSAP